MRKLLYPKIQATHIYIFIFLFICFSLFCVRIMGGDDSIFCIPFKDISIKALLGINARIIPNFIASLLTSKDLIIWRIITSFMFTLLIYSISYIISYPIRLSEKKKIKIILFIALTFFYTYPFVITSTTFWVSGSYIYLWSASLGLFSFLHFIKYYNQEKPSVLKVIAFLIASFYAAYGQEQISILLSSFSLLLLLYYYFKNGKSPNKFLIIQTTIYLSGTLFLLMYPANNGRFQFEIQHCYPEFLSLSYFDKIFRGLIWLCNQLFNKERYLMIVLLSLLVLYNRRFNLNKTRKAFFFYILILPIIIMVLTSIPIDSFLNSILRETPHNYRISIDALLKDLVVMDIKKYVFTETIEIIKFSFWLFYLLAIPLMILFIGVEKLFNCRLSIIYVASVLSSSIMFFSPTIYESKHRVFFSMDILLILLIGILFEKLGLFNLSLKRFLILYSLYPVLIYIILQWQWNSGFYIMH